jgi:hypothetical protein
MLFVFIVVHKKSLACIEIEINDGLYLENYLGQIKNEFI